MRVDRIGPATSGYNHDQWYWFAVGKYRIGILKDPSISRWADYGTALLVQRDLPGGVAEAKYVLHTTKLRTADKVWEYVCNALGESSR